MIPLGGYSGRIILSSTGRFGVRPDEFATGGDFDSPLLACVDPGDENTEFAWVIRSLPSSGTLAANDDGGMSHTGAADGSYTVPFGLYTWAPGGPGVYEGDTSFTTTFGAVAIVATEVDAALALAALQLRAVGVATETDAAVALPGVQQRAVGLATEADQAFALAAFIPGGVGVAAETDSAFALASVQIRAVGMAVETDEAIARTAGTSAPVGLATESDTAFALAAVQRLLVGIAAEIDAALALAGPAGAFPADLSAAWAYRVPGTAGGFTYRVPGEAGGLTHRAE